MFHNDSTILHLSHLALTKKSQGGQGSTNSPFKPPKGKQPYGGCQMKDQIKRHLSQGGHCTYKASCVSKDLDLKVLKQFIMYFILQQTANIKSIIKVIMA